MGIIGLWVLGWAPSMGHLNGSELLAPILKLVSKCVVLEWVCRDFLESRAILGDHRIYFELVGGLSRLFLGSCRAGLELI